MHVKGKVFLVQWDAEAAAARTRDLRVDGWSVDQETEDGERAYRAIRAEQPDVVIIDLSLKPAHGREVARSLREIKTLMALPIVFVDGDDRAVEKARARVPDAIFTDAAGLTAALAGYAQSGNG